MPKKYVFEFQGTKEMFLDSLNKIYHGDGKFYYINDYIVKIIGNEIHFGVERCGHSGGYWFISRITEFDNRIEFSGTIKYIGPNENQSTIKKVFDKIDEIVFSILLFPIYLLFKLYTIVEWCVRKVFNRAKPKAETTEDKLYDLMEKHLNCIRQ